MFDVRGRRVATASVVGGTARVPTTGLAPGVYVVRATSGGARSLVVLR